MVIRFKVDEQTLTASYSPLIVSRSQDYLKARFTFTEDWYGTQKIAQFVRSELKYNILLDENNICLVPWELLQTEGEFSLTVWGNNLPNQDNIIITTNKLIIKVSADGLDDELLPTDPTVGVEGGLLVQCQEAAESAQQSAESAATSAENAGTAKTTAVNSAAAALSSEQRAKSSEDAAALSQQSAAGSASNALSYKNAAAQSASDALGYKNDAGNSATAAALAEQHAKASEEAAAASAAILANTPHFEFDGDGYLYLNYSS